MQQPTHFIQHQHQINANVAIGATPDAETTIKTTTASVSAPIQERKTFMPINIATSNKNQIAALLPTGTTYMPTVANTMLANTNVSNSFCYPVNNNNIVASNRMSTINQQVRNNAVNAATTTSNSVIKSNQQKPMLKSPMLVGVGNANALITDLQLNSKEITLKPIRLANAEQAHAGARNTMPAITEVTLTNAAKKTTQLNTSIHSNNNKPTTPFKLPAPIQTKTANTVILQTSSLANANASRLSAKTFSEKSAAIPTTTKAANANLLTTKMQTEIRVPQTVIVNPIPTTTNTIMKAISTLSTSTSTPSTVENIICTNNNIKSTNLNANTSCMNMPVLVPIASSSKNNKQPILLPTTTVIMAVKQQQQQQQPQQTNKVAVPSASSNSQIQSATDVQQENLEKLDNIKENKQPMAANSAANNSKPTVLPQLVPISTSNKNGNEEKQDEQEDQKQNEAQQAMQLPRCSTPQFNNGIAADVIDVDLESGEESDYEVEFLENLDSSMESSQEKLNHFEIGIAPLDDEQKIKSSLPMQLQVETELDTDELEAPAVIEIETINNSNAEMNKPIKVAKDAVYEESAAKSSIEQNDDAADAVEEQPNNNEIEQEKVTGENPNTVVSTATEGRSRNNYEVNVGVVAAATDEDNIDDDDDDVCLIIETPEEQQTTAKESSIAADAANSLLCAEKMNAVSPNEMSSSKNDSISSNNNNNNNNLQHSKNQTLEQKKQKQKRPQQQQHPQQQQQQQQQPHKTVNSKAMVDMMSYFDMLKWNDRVGIAKIGNMRFEMNEFNFVQIAERCPRRKYPVSAFQKPIPERSADQIAAPVIEKQNDTSTTPLLYKCRTCKTQNPAINFIAPEYCSLMCAKVKSMPNVRKRPAEQFIGGNSVKRQRKEIKAHVFSWNLHLTKSANATPAPVSLFNQAFPRDVKHHFIIGMKLEAIDPENSALFCVCTVADIRGYRLKLRFDGYDYIHDFWVNADSIDIFPPNFCYSTKRILQPPPGWDKDSFTWEQYMLTHPRHRLADPTLFKHIKNLRFLSHRFQVGMHLEAEDLNDTRGLCVATVADILGDRIRIHFDGWDESYDYWANIKSPYIHPCGYHQQKGMSLLLPLDYDEKKRGQFNWNTYIKEQNTGIATTPDMYCKREPVAFLPDMKLEVVDPCNRELIRPATVVRRNGYILTIHLDGWPAEYTLELEDDSTDMHPVGWCEHTKHPLEVPPGYIGADTNACPIRGCRGVGNMNCVSMFRHTQRDCCPYAPENWKREPEKPQRLSREQMYLLSIPCLLPRPVSASSSGGQSSYQKQAYQQQQLKQQQQQLKQNGAKKIATQSPPQQSQSLIVGKMTRPVSLPMPNQQMKIEIKTSTSANASPTSIDQNQFNFSPLPTATENVGTDSTKKGINLKVDLEEEHTFSVAKSYLCDYGPRLQQNFELWQRNCKFDPTRIRKNPENWSCKQTAAYIESALKSKDIAAKFVHEDIDGYALLLLQQSDLVDILQLKLGPAVKLMSLILNLRTLVATEYAAADQSAKHQ